ncbi:uncharacterized protein LOC124534209 [Vanessa cardui]|uniref:uncharacterized protein LOC124534209 n=1 Tax=Vanessa cardui TaxID=171605 RepID=UPI001F149394|nr:uncharacterized protein LOC124534209 [Vanessa cardui]
MTGGELSMLILESSDPLKYLFLLVTFNKQWIGDVHSPGVILQCEPASGDLRSRSKSSIQVSVYADCWGFYYDQILIQIENLEPLIVDVWIEAVGEPLEFALRPIDQLTQPTLWMSSTDPERMVLVKNTSRAELVVYGYVLKDNDYPQDVLPFRLYIRLFDVPRSVCPCVTKFNSDSTTECDSLWEDMDTGVELYLDSDRGVQSEEFYQVEPLECHIKPSEKVNYKVRLLPKNELAPHATLVLRPLPLEQTGSFWCRPAPPLQFVQLRQTLRTSCLQASVSELKVTLCALDLPYNDTLRVRKRFYLQNVGDGLMEIYAETEPPWTLDVARQICDAHCIKVRSELLDRLKLCLPPRSSTEMVAEVSLKTNAVWPAGNEKYLPKLVSTTIVCFFELENVKLLCIPLVLEIEYPVVTTEPAVIDFGDVSDEGTRKTYVTVSHSSPLSTLDLLVSWSGGEQFRLWPTNLTLQPGVSARVYIEYTAMWWSGSSAEGTVSVAACGPAGRWCAAAARVSARPQRCAARAPPHVDYTDDTHLIPRDVCHVLKQK